VTEDGRSFSARIDYPRGDPENPLTREELLGKFDDLTSPIYPVAKRQEIVSQVLALEHAKDMKEFCKLFAA
jgi:2-methylcitrate dehydratase PrpD